MISHLAAIEYSLMKELTLSGQNRFGTGMITKMDPSKSAMQGRMNNIDVSIFMVTVIYMVFYKLFVFLQKITVLA